MNTNAKSAVAGVVALAMGVGIGVGIAQAYQPHMGSALSDLQLARSELQAASPDKGGHRIAAINLVDRAINQVQAGIVVGAGY